MKPFPSSFLSCRHRCCAASNWKDSGWKRENRRLSLAVRSDISEETREWLEQDNCLQPVVNQINDWIMNSITRHVLIVKDNPIWINEDFCGTFNATQLGLLRALIENYKRLFDRYWRKLLHFRKNVDSFYAMTSIRESDPESRPRYRFRGTVDT